MRAKPALDAGRRRGRARPTTGVTVYAVKGEDHVALLRHVRAALAHRPHITIDDGADLVSSLLFLALGKDSEVDPVSRRGGKPARRTLRPLAGVIGGTEETTTGVLRLRAMERDGALLKFPVVAVNDAEDEAPLRQPLRHGPEHDRRDHPRDERAPRRANVVVAGYGWCGRGVAMRARGLGAQVIVTEIDPTKAMEAALDGYRVMPMAKAAPIGDVFVTVTGNATSVLRESTSAR